jgi:hypothetical protein
MGKKAYLRRLSIDDELDFDQQDDDEHLIEFHNLLFNELLCNIKKVSFDDIINTRLTYDGAKIYLLIKSNSLDWLYTADRLNINNIIVYSFRFPSPCHPDYYKSFIAEYHPYFKLSKQNRHGLKGWCNYIGEELPKTIVSYLNIAKIIQEQTSYEPKIFVNNNYERLDIEFYLRSGNIRQRLTITFEPGCPALT